VGGGGQTIICSFETLPASDTQKLQGTIKLRATLTFW